MVLVIGRDEKTLRAIKERVGVRGGGREGLRAYSSSGLTLSSVP